MKKIYSLITSVLIAAGTFAQTNLGLETWEGTPPARLTGWGFYPWTNLSTDYLPTNIVDLFVPSQGGTITIGGNNATLVQQVSTGASEGTYYAELSTATIAGLTGDFEDLNGILGGSISQTIATSTVYTSVTFKYKATIQTGDVAFAWVEARKNGVVVSGGQLPIAASAAAWTDGTITMSNYTDLPDTIDIIFVSSVGSIFTGTGIPEPVEGTKLMIDDVRFLGNAAGIEENSLTINAYPNPANDVLNISISEEASSVLVISMDGKIITRQEVNGNSTSIDVTALSSGIYFYEVVTTSGNTVRNSFMKN
jgi:hypothetical protein